MQEKLGRLQPAAMQKPGGCEHAGESGDSQESSHCQSGPSDCLSAEGGTGQNWAKQEKLHWAWGNSQRGPMAWVPSTAQTRRSPNLA